ncbi:MAG TPA: hypothetical protein VFV38_30440 [Ktedonobacteraceae bacterium]|nr:hypothetical protein [Ktedonobacteraceae bacterium]
MTNPHIQSEQTFTRVHTLATVVTETETLALQGFTEDEIVSLLWLRQWYQHGGSDRMEVVRRLEFLKHLVLRGQIEL